MKRFWLSLILLIALGGLVYANSLGNPFIWDDDNLIVSNPYIKDIRLLKNIFTKDLGYGTQFSNFYRPLQSLSFELDYYLWGLNPRGYHFTNLILHIACAIALYFLFSLTFIKSRFIPLITAALFLVHPIQTEAVTYISGRADPLAGLFMLLSLSLYIKSSRAKTRVYLYGAVGCFILALLSKEMALVLPVLLWLYDVSFAQKRSRRYLLFFAIALVYIILRLTALNFVGMPVFSSADSLSLRLLTTLKILALYLGLLILPFNLHMERSIPTVSGLLEQDVLLALALFILLAILIVRGFKYSRIYFFGGLWFVICLLPFANIIALNANMAEHWLYLASIGFFLLIAVGIDKLAAQGAPAKTAALILCAGLLGFYSFLTIQRNRDWRNPQSFFQSILAYSPKSAEAHNCLGAIYRDQGKLDLAVAEFKQAIKAQPQNFKCYGNLGATWRRQGKLDLAQEAYKQALALQPGIPGLYNNLGNIYVDKQDWPRAKEMFERALQLYPEFALCRVNLGKVYYETGKMDLALAEFKRAAALEPALVPAHYNLAVIYHLQQKYLEAINEYETALLLDPGHRQARFNLERAYKATGRRRTEEQAK